MKSAGVVLLGVASTSFTLAHFNECIAALTGTLTFAIVALKFYRTVKKMFLPGENKKATIEEKEETTV